MDDGGLDGVEGLEGLADILETMEGVVAGPVPVVLLDGAEVSGPFKDCDEQGRPLVEIWEVELTAATGGARPHRLGMVGLVACDSGPADVLAAYGPGVWVCTVRGLGGKIIRQRFLTTGTKAQRQAKAVRSQRQVQRQAESPESADDSPAWMRQFLAQQAEQSRRQEERREEEAKAAREELARRRREEEEERRQELKDLRAEVRRVRETPPTPPSRPSELIGGLRDWLQEGDQIRDMLGNLVPRSTPDAPPAPSKGFVEEVAGELGNLLKSAGDLKELLKVVE